MQLLTRLALAGRVCVPQYLSLSDSLAARECVWVDRHLRRPTMVVADLGRAATLFLAPLSALLFSITLGLLYAVILLELLPSSSR